MEQIINICKEKNSVVRSNLDNSKRNENLLDFVNNEFAKTIGAKGAEGYSPQELTEIIKEYICVRSGKTIAEKAVLPLKSNTLMMADHYGGIYSTQSFQGDLLYIKGLKEMGLVTEVIPVLACGQVPLDNSTFPRGMIYYEGDGMPLRLPVMTTKHRASAAGAAPGFNDGDVEKFIKRIKKDVKGKNREALVQLAEEIYKNDTVLNEKDFKSQMYYVSKDVMERCLDGETVIYVDFEEVFGKLFLKDIERPNSLCYRILYDELFLKTLKEEMPDISLFVGLDKKGKKFYLSLDSDGFLRGKTRNNEEIIYKTEPEIIQNLIKEKKVYVSVYACAVMSAFQRGMMLFGGIFQSVYLEEWKKKTIKALKNAGCEKEADRINTVAGNGYMSGPIFALTNGGGGFVNAGPLEMILHNKTFKDIEHLVNETSIYDGHMMGMYEFYNDLTTADKKCEQWYEKLNRFFKENYEKNCI